MKSPKKVKEVQRLNRGIAMLSRLIPRSADRYQPFFRLLKTKTKIVEWSTICEKYFGKLKKTLI